ncbi:MAG: YncE family protein [Minisyncoccia bacterium]
MDSLRNLALASLVIFSVFSLTNIAPAQVVTLPAGTRTDYAVGISPYGVVFDNVTNSIWVTNSYSGTISKVNINTGTSIDYVVEANPYGVAFDNVTNSVWVVNNSSNTVSKVDIITGARIDYVVGIGSVRVAFDNVTNSVWVTNYFSNTIRKINIYTGAWTDYATASFPYGVAFDNVTNSVWVANANSNTVSKVDINTGARIDYTVGIHPYDVAFDSMTNSVWVTNYYSNTVSKVDTKTGTRVDYAVGTNPYGVAFDNVTNSVWITNLGLNTVSKVNINNGTRIDYPVGVASYGIAFESITNSVWVANYGSNTVSKIAIGASANTAPAISTFGQFKSDGMTTITESGITAEQTIAFKATLSDIDNDQIKLQVELKESSKPFDDTKLLESGFVASGSIATTSEDLIADGQYHWRARAVDDKGNVSEWQEFGVVGAVDFNVKTVPLYTQVRSNYPSDALTDGWARETYAAGRGNLGPVGQRCGLSIANCGCAITSMVMLGRYYGVDVDIDGSGVDPLAIDKWLTGNGGYSPYGKLYWSKAVDYLGYIDPITNKKMIRFGFNGTTDWNVASTSPRIANYLNSGKPIVAYNKKVGHYMILDNKLSDTYTVKDPAWYNTKTLTETQNLTNHIRGYGNYFSTANIFTYLDTPKLVANSMHIALASPAELLITDPQGRKLGKDPVTGTVYNEIPNAIYMNDGPIVTSDIDLDQSQIHETKEISIETPVDGNYQLQVIGTGTGSYTLDSLAYDYNGDSHSQTLAGNTQPAFVDEYSLNFTPAGVPVNLDLTLTSQGIDECPTLSGINLGCPAIIDFLSQEKISNSAGVPELAIPTGETRYTAPVVAGERGTTEVKAKLYDENKLLAILGTRSVPSDQLCVIFDDTAKDNALANHLIKTTDTQGKFSFGVSSSVDALTLIESVRETIAGQSKRVCIAETVSPRDFVVGVATKEVSQITLTVRNTNSGILVKKTAGHNSQTIDY